MVIGVVGSIVTLGSIEILDKLKIDDPVGKYNETVNKWHKFIQPAILFLLFFLTSLLIQNTCNIMKFSSILIYIFTVYITIARASLLYMHYHVNYYLGGSLTLV